MISGTRSVPARIAVAGEHAAPQRGSRPRQRFESLKETGQEMASEDPTPIVLSVAAVIVFAGGFLLWRRHVRRKARLSAGPAEPAPPRRKRTPTPREDVGAQFTMADDPQAPPPVASDLWRARAGSAGILKADGIHGLEVRVTVASVDRSALVLECDGPGASWRSGMKGHLVLASPGGPALLAHVILDDVDLRRLPVVFRAIQVAGTRGFELPEAARTAVDVPCTTEAHGTPATLRVTELGLDGATVAGMHDVPPGKRFTLRLALERGAEPFSLLAEVPVKVAQPSRHQGTRVRFVVCDLPTRLRIAETVWRAKAGQLTPLQPIRRPG